MPFWNKLFGQNRGRGQGQGPGQGPGGGQGPRPGQGPRQGQGPGQGMGPGPMMPESTPPVSPGQGLEKGRQPEGFSEGPGGKCVCPKCGTKTPHLTGKPCYEMDCPNCGQKMTRPNTGE